MIDWKTSNSTVMVYLVRNKPVELQVWIGKAKVFLETNRTNFEFTVEVC